MSYELINRSPDLKQLRDEGYNVTVTTSGHLLIEDVPYLNSTKEIRLGTLVSVLTLAGDVATTPDNHVVYWTGDYPCHLDGSEIAQIRNESAQRTLAEGLVIQHTFSGKPAGGFKNYYDKMTNYIVIISGPAQAIDHKITAKTFPVVESKEEESVFRYIDTASSRAQINVVTDKLKLGKIAIVGLGGTGSYVLDLLAKTPVKEIHLFDGDRFSQHNAFRSPGAPSVDELRGKHQKAVYFKERYSPMHRAISRSRLLHGRIERG